MFKNLSITSLLGFIAVVLGAFGAHSLQEVLTPAQLLSFETAVRYQMYHVLVLLLINLHDGFSSQQKNGISGFFFAGIVFFSGSIYLIQLTPVTAASVWFVTPLGGLFLLIGWLTLFMIFLKKWVKK
ncbi:DUF423 domain-containing protein [Polaribacter sp. HL-MS24]|uniref:DUF423 domain-containing protein n=1 Tax=Polaribacter sp. HL-MS24 TaxID=3077735 RepID=UPI0029347552|nr:DUF423 domain-containing protein [Polaribacter sp. HL-MS24]WOC39573.1 DUF423 domain-containing protein [Polaribacter sp. HL-MS24]